MNKASPFPVRFIRLGAQRGRNEFLKVFVSSKNLHNNNCTNVLLFGILSPNVVIFSYAQLSFD